MSIIGTAARRGLAREIVMARRLDKTLIDYLVIAISPALIMTLIGSLVYFLLEVFYQGQHGIRLQYVFTLFVFAAVLIARIAIEQGREYAQIFSIFLGIATLLVLNKFMAYHAGPLAGFGWLINLTLIVAIWWCADKLTWDCTLIDETERDAGEGVLQSAGLDTPATAAAKRDVTEQEQPQGATSSAVALKNWWQRYIERRRRPHAPGVWVVYFSLAALPLFGIGQRFIPAADRQYVFKLLFVYVASGLGLLLTTSFLALRRYLRQRSVEMPPAMANTWLTVGSILIVALLAFATLLPRPSAEYAISRLPFTIGSPDRTPSRYAMGKDGVEDKQDRSRSATNDQRSDLQDGRHDGKSGAQGGPQNEGGRSPAEKRQGRESESPDGKQEGKSESKSGEQGGEDQSSATEDDDSDDSAEPSDADSPGEANRDPRGEKPKPEDRPRDGSDRNSLQPPPRLSPATTNLGPLMALVKWIFYGIVILLAGYAIWRYWAEVLAAVREFWQNLFGRKRRTGEEVAGGQRAEPSLSRPFTDFADPFATGMAGRYSPDELVKYSFEALQAWAREHGCARESEQTPHEFAGNVGTCVSMLSRDAWNLAELYCLVAYAPGTLRLSSTDPLEQLWRHLGIDDR